MLEISTRHAGVERSRSIRQLSPARMMRCSRSTASANNVQPQRLQIWKYYKQKPGSTAPCFATSARRPRQLSARQGPLPSLLILPKTPICLRNTVREFRYCGALIPMPNSTGHSTPYPYRGFWRKFQITATAISKPPDWHHPDSRSGARTGRRGRTAGRCRAAPNYRLDKY